MCVVVAEVHTERRVKKLRRGMMGEMVEIIVQMAKMTTSRRPLLTIALAVAHPHTVKKGAGPK